MFIKELPENIHQRYSTNKYEQRSIFFVMPKITVRVYNIGNFLKSFPQHVFTKLTFFSSCYPNDRPDKEMASLE